MVGEKELLDYLRQTPPHSLFNEISHISVRMKSEAIVANTIERVLCGEGLNLSFILEKWNPWEIFRLPWTWRQKRWVSLKDAMRARSMGITNRYLHHVIHYHICSLYALLVVKGVNVRADFEAGMERIRIEENE